MDGLSSLGPRNTPTNRPVEDARHSLGAGNFLNRVAEKLEIDPVKLREAFDAARTEGDRSTGVLTTVANELGIEPQALLRALREAQQGVGVRQHPARGSVSPTDSDDENSTPGGGGLVDATA
jgi:hypothetical protein